MGSRTIAAPKACTARLATHMALRGSTAYKAAANSSPLSAQGMELLVDYDYVAIFDADFKPDPDFLVCDKHVCYAGLQARSCCPDV